MSFPWCVVLGPARIANTQTRGVALLEALWKPDEVITVSFLDGDPTLCSRVAHVAKQWIDRTGARLTFEFRTDTTKTDIRISFRNAGSWSRLGRTCRAITDGSATMNFGWLDPASLDEDVREVVLHEFGHALGLLHEHQHPEAQIPWDREAVVAALSGPPNNWDLATIEENVLTGYQRGDVRATPFDVRSIMLYPINPKWTARQFSTKNNTDLSPEDIALIRDIYG